MNRSIVYLQKYKSEYKRAKGLVKTLKNIRE